MSEADSKRLFENTFATNYYNFKSGYSDQQDAARKALALAKMAAAMSGIQIDDELFSKWSLEMFVKYRVGISIVKPPVIREEPPSGWYDKKMTAASFFWTRYREYLSRIKKWPTEAVEAIDESTHEIMASLGNPESPEPFDKRGLVLGYVQSGKTANFTGLINKAYDVGYKLIIVLSGIHNDLRAQTQIRLNEEVVGSTVDKDKNPIGVAQIYQNTPDHIISSWTTADRDINSAQNGIVSNITQRTLMVVKKNGTVLKSLKEQLEYLRDLYSLDIPVLIIDDEADQASVDTSKAEEDPKTINRLIRQILEIFSRKAYVGYTATPFANLLISLTAKTDDEGSDLYPKDFLVGLPKPAEYCGHEEFFNIEEDPDDPRPSLIRVLEKEDIEVFAPIKKSTDASKFEEVPPMMREAIMAFLLTVAIRNLRGQKNKHNSMLIHTSRFKDVQSFVKKEVENTFDAISKQLQYNSSKSKVLDSLKKLYETDFRKMSKEWPEDLPDYDWEEVYSELREIAEKIKVFEINGNSKDALHYHQYKQEGLNVIAVGGDKLSRGLTLEGLSITYYFRNTLMYDTLMQMGRWFGYRKGYMDLCRIYTSEEIASNFEHLAIAMIELRKEFDHIAKQNLTPAEYAVKMLAHPTMTLTSPLKMRNASVTDVIYGGTLQQTRYFDNDESFYRKNMEATEHIINKLPFNKVSIGKGASKYYMASGVDSSLIKEYLSEYQTSRDAEKVDAAKIASYISLANEKGELKNWTVAIVEGDPSDRKKAGSYSVKLGKLSLESAVARGTTVKHDPVISPKVDIRAIVSPNQEYIDLEQENLRGISDRTEKRGLRSKQNGLLLIYPLNPQVSAFNKLDVAFSEEMVPIGIAFSFPKTDIDETSVYQTNSTVGRDANG